MSFLIEKEEAEKISIHALREEGDPCKMSKVLFPPYFYPRPPRGGRLPSGRFCPACCCISIHALREEGDGEFYTPQSVDLKFLSTPSARRATEQVATHCS